MSWSARCPRCGSPPASSDPERLSVAAFVDEIGATGVLHSEYRGVRLTVLAVDPALVVDGDPQLLTSAVMNVLQNAFKYTPAGGTVTFGAHARAGRVLIEGTGRMRRYSRAERRSVSSLRGPTRR